MARAMPTSSSASAVSVGRRFALAGAVVERAGGREAERAGLDGLGRRSGHGLDVLGGGRLAVGAPLPHDVQAQRAVGHLERDVDVERATVDGVHELGEALPVPRQALGEDDAGDVLDALHQLDEPLVVGGSHGREADPAVAGDDGGDAVPRRRDHPLVPRGLAVVVGVDVDEAGGDEQAVGVDGARRGALDRADLGDDAVADGHVGRAGLGARAVDDGAAADDQVVLAHGAPRSCRAGRISVTSSALGGAGVVALGAEGGAGDDEPVDAEVGQLAQAGDADLGRADHGEAVDERRLQRVGVVGGVAQVLAAVVATPDLGHDLLVAVGEAGPGGPGHRREVGERGDAAADQRTGDVEVGVAADVDVRAEGDRRPDRGRRRRRPCGPGRSPTRPVRGRRRRRR